MPICFAQNLDLRVHVQKCRCSGGYVEAFVHVLSDSEASETYGYLVWVILANAIIRWSREMQLSIIILVYKVECICSNEYRKDRLVFYDRYASLSNENMAKKIWKESEYWQGSNNLPIWTVARCIWVKSITRGLKLCDFIVLWNVSCSLKRTENMFDYILTGY